MEEEIESNNTDSSEDSVEIRVKSISSSSAPLPPIRPALPKRKSFIPKKIVRREEVLLPPVKRPCLDPVQTEPLSLVVFKPVDSKESSSSASSSSATSTAQPPQSSSAIPSSVKNMAPQRRVEANARERQRVHTITNAFDRLQSAIPSPSESSVKLSKLSVIKIATAYIMVLSRMVGHDYSPDGSAPSVEACISACQELIESESRFKVRRRSEQI